MPVLPQITLNGTIDDLYGAALLDGSLAVQLVNFGSQVPRISGTALIASTAPLAIDCPAGTFSFKLWGNDVIVPAGTYYVIQILDDNGDVVQVNAYQFNGTQVLDLSTVAPYNPNIVVAPVAPTVFGQDVILPFNANMVIPGNLGTCFEVTLTGNVITDVMNNVQPGTLYTFLVVQDGAGNRAWVWPANVIDAEPVDLNPNRISTQTFIARSNGNLYAIGPLNSR